MTTPRRTRLRVSGLLVALALAAGACGDSSDTDAGAPEESTATTAATAEGATSNSEGGTSTSEGDCAAAGAEPSGTLRIAEFAPVTTFDPVGSQTAQSAFLYPVYDTLTRQNAEFELEPALATSWSQPEPNVWQFELRDDVTFHDGETFNAEVVKANLERAATTAGNPNATAFEDFVSAEVVDEHTVKVNFESPSPAFPLEMSMVMGMMVSPAALDGDLTRNPAGSGPWIWQEGESQAGVQEVYTLNPDYWDPAAQGVERIEILAVADNDARFNALRTGDVDMMATVRDAQIDPAEAAGLQLLSVDNNVPYLVITDRAGQMFEPLADERVRQAIFYAVDREAYVQITQAGQGDARGGIFPESLPEYYAPDLDDLYAHDPERAKELLAEAGYPDGIDIEMPVMPAITPAVEALVQMLGQAGIRVTLNQIPNGQLGPTLRNGEAAISWNRFLVYYPSQMFKTFLPEEGNYNPFHLDDAADLVEMMEEADAMEDPEARKPIFDEIQREMVERGILMPLGHAKQTAAYGEQVSCVVMGLNMQAPMPYGVRVDG